MSGFSTTAVMPHAGFIFFHPIVQSLPPDLRQKAARIISGKCTLAARADSLHSALDGSIGESLANQIKQKIDKMLEPPPVKDKKALPKPLDKASKKRGGKRARKLKERLGMTELRKRQNRMNFGELQEDVMQEHMQVFNFKTCVIIFFFRGFTLGQAKSETIAGGGRIRASVIDNKTRIRFVLSINCLNSFVFLECPRRCKKLCNDSNTVGSLQSSQRLREPLLQFRLLR